MQPTARLALALCAALALACAQPPAPAPPPPAPARPLASYAVKSTMGLLAEHMSAVDAMLSQGPPADAAARDALWEHLNAMAILAGEVDERGLPSDDPHAGWRLSSLRHDIKLARVAVGAEPPAYYLVGKLTASCSYCHEQRR